MSYLQTRVITHRQLVCSLYKRALRNAEDWSQERIGFRFEACLLRQRFEEHRHEKDMRKAKQLLEDGEKELLRIRHFQPHKFPGSPGGVAYEREVYPPDWILDYWHPLEKAQYPEYFARREQRKKEYVEKWEREFGRPENIDNH